MAFAGAEWPGGQVEGQIGGQTGSSPSPTSQQPSTQAFTGLYNFKVNFLKLSSTAKNKSWDVSSEFMHVTSFTIC